MKSLTTTKLQTWVDYTNEKLKTTKLQTCVLQKKRYLKFHQILNNIPVQKNDWVLPQTQNFCSISLQLDGVKVRMPNLDFDLT